MPSPARGGRVITLALVLAVLQAPGAVRGRVVDAVSGLPVQQAVVRADGGLARTDAVGRFALTGLAPGELRLSVHRLGYGAVELALTIVPGAPTAIEVRLTPLPEVVPALEVRDAGAQSVMTGEEARSRGRTLADALDGWAGVVVQRRAPGGAAAPVVRGSAPHEVLVVVDGVPLNNAWTGVADLSRIATANVDHLRLVPGAQGAPHGASALAGALVVRTVVRPGVRGSAWTGSYGMAGTGLDGALSAGRWRLGAYGELERNADAYPVSLPASRGGGETTRENAGAQVVRGSLRLEGPVQVSARGHLARRGLPGTLTNPSRTGESREAWLTISGWGGPVLLTVDALTSEASDSSPPLGPPYRSTVGAIGAGGTMRLAGVGGFDVEGGVRADRFEGSALADQRAISARAHLALARTLATSVGAWRLSAVPTARIDAWSLPGSPAASLRLDVTGERGPVSVHLAAGSSASHPILADHLFHEGVGVRPNPSLRPERVAWEVEAGAWTRWRTLGFVGTTSARAFVGRVEDLVLWAPDFRFVWSPANFDVHRSGIDVGVSAEAPSARLAVSSTLALARVRYDRPGAPQVIYRPQDVVTGSLAWRPTAWRIRLGVRRIGTRFPNHGGVNALAPATVWDASVDRSIWFAGATLDLGLAVRDVFDRRLEHVAGQPLAGRTFTLRVELGNR